MKPEPFVSCADSGPLTILGENNQSDGGPSRVVFCSGPAPHTAVQSSQTGCVAVTRVLSGDAASWEVVFNRQQCTRV